MFQYARIVKLQAHIRGWLVRRRNKRQVSQHFNNQASPFSECGRSMQRSGSSSELKADPQLFGKMQELMNFILYHLLYPETSGALCGKDLRPFYNPKIFAFRQKLGPMTCSEVLHGKIFSLIQQVIPIYFKDEEVLYYGETVSTNTSKQVKTGLGVQLWRDGSMYEGEFFSGKPHGKGRLIHSKSQLPSIQDDETKVSETIIEEHGSFDVYEGDWLDGKAHGYGEYLNANGTSYKGYWIADKQHGMGVESWPDGSCYQGPYIAGNKHGE